MMTDYINLLRSLQPHPDELTGKVWLRPELAREIASALNAARQRAEQAERERDGARELLSRIRAITTASLSPLDWTPKTGAEIVADMEGRPAILPPDFDIDAPAPTVKAAEPLWRSMTHLVGVGEISYSDTMNLIGHRLRIAHDCINQSETQTDAALEQMHHALVLLYHALDLRGGAS